MTVFIAPGLCVAETWLVARPIYHAEAYFHLKWAKRMCVLYALCSAEFLLVPYISQIFYPQRTRRCRYEENAHAC